MAETDNSNFGPAPLSTPITPSLQLGWVAWFNKIHQLLTRLADAVLGASTLTHAGRLTKVGSTPGTVTESAAVTETVGTGTATVTVQAGASQGSNKLLVLEDSTGTSVFGVNLPGVSPGYVAIGTANPGVQASAGRGYLTVSGPTLCGALEFITPQADADANVVGLIQFTDQLSTSGDKRVAIIQGLTSGTVASNRGGLLRLLTKPDGASGPASRLVITNNGDCGLGVDPPGPYRLDVVGDINSATALRIGGTKVVGAQQPAIAAPAGGSVIDVQARAAITSIINELHNHGLIG